MKTTYNTNEQMFKDSDNRHANLTGELFTIHTDREYNRDDFNDLINHDFFIYIDLHTKIVFKSELWILDNYAGKYTITKQFKGV